MHELGVAEGILAVVAEIAAGRPVSRVVVRVGDGQCIAPDSLAFSFALLADGTICAGATLECVAVAGDVLLVDAVELAGDPPAIIRRPGADAAGPRRAPSHHSHPGATPAPVGPGP
jgi:hypothetical protein